MRERDRGEGREKTTQYSLVQGKKCFLRDGRITVYDPFQRGKMSHRKEENLKGKCFININGTRVGEKKRSERSGFLYNYLYIGTLSKNKKTKRLTKRCFKLVTL